MAENDANRRDVVPEFSDFVEARKKGYYVDKSLLIEEVMDYCTLAEATLILRPRGFGKTMSLSMLKTFYEKTEEDNSVYFKDLKIWERGEEIRAEQGKYPVICLNLDGLSGNDWNEMMENFKTAIINEYKRHPEIGVDLDEYDSRRYNEIVNGTGSSADYTFSFKVLSDLLYKHYKVRPIVLIDEYDYPIQKAVEGNYSDHAISFLRSFLSCVLKGNSSLEFGIIMSVARAFNESIFSGGLNNLIVESVLSDRFSHQFGFTEEDVDKILSDHGCSNKKKEVREWYGGYRMGSKGVQLYNPWSVLSYVNNGCNAETYWADTSESKIIGDMLDDESKSMARDFNMLLYGEEITTWTNENITYEEFYVDKCKEGYTSHIYALLLMFGYLTSPESSWDYCELTIPNREICEIYMSEIRGRMCLSDEAASRQSVSAAIKKKDAEGFKSVLERYVATSINYAFLKDENAYEMLMVGIFALIGNEYEILILDERSYSWKRSGQALVPKKKYKNILPAIVFDCERFDDDNDLEGRALAVRERTDKEEHDVKLKELGYERVIKFGVAYCGSRVAVKTEYVDK